MRFLQSSCGRPYFTTLGVRQFGLAVAFTSMAIAVGWLLMPWLGVLGAYLPLLMSVAATTWISGLWPSLLSQVLGVSSALFLTSRSTGAPISKADLYAVLLFLLIAKLMMFLLLNVRINNYLQQNKTHLELIAQSTHDSLWEWDFATNYVWRGGKTAEVFGCSEEEIKPELDWWLKRIHPADEKHVWSSLRRAIDTRNERWSSEYRLRQNNGNYAIVSDHGFIIRNKKDVPVRMFGGMVDVSAQRRAEEHLLYSASHDALTGLPNRESVLNQLNRLLKKSRYQDDGTLAVLFIDIDRFKTVNDSIGRSHGDQVLIAVASRLTRCLRQTDIASRFGGDEFIVLLNHVETSAEAIHIAERVQQSFSAPFEVSGHSIRISASIGIAFAESTQAEEVIRQADLAMYQAKAKGRSRFQIFEPVLESRARYALQAETDLRQSFHNGSLQLYYQPMISLQSGRIFGFEALLRWQHSKRGLIRPSEILSIADEAGLSAQLGQWVLRTSCTCLSRWKKFEFVSPSLVMSCNLSGKELTRPNLVSEVEGLLNEVHLDGRSLMIELTETTIMESDIMTTQKLERLRKLGIQLALDDFGRGHSSLARLQDLPISTLKIDNLFVKQVEAGRPQILNAIMALAHELKLVIVTEGVETPVQLQYVQQRGSTLAQGFLFAGPLPEQQAFQLLSNNRLWSVRATARSNSELQAGVVAGS